MLSLCNNFKIFGDGGNRLILIADTKEGQRGFIINDPFIDSFSFEQEFAHVTTMGERKSIQIPTSQMTKLSMIAGKAELIEGDNLSKLYDPVMQKTIRELLSIIDFKLEDRE